MLRATFLICAASHTLAFTLMPLSTPYVAAPRASSLPITMTENAGLDLDIVDDNSYEAVISESAEGKPVIVDFFTDWCGPCKLVEPLLRELHATGEVKVVKAKPEETESFRKWLSKQGKQVAALPTCVLFENGAPSRVLAGGFTRERLEKFVSSAARGVVRGSKRILPGNHLSALAQLGATQQLQPIPVPVIGTTSPHARWSTKSSRR